MMTSLTNRTALEVLDHHIRVLGAGLVDEVVADYADDAVILTPGGPTRGRGEIRLFFENSVQNVLPPDSEYHLLEKKVVGELALILWSAESAFYSIPFGTDTFIIRAGQIHLQTFAGVLNQKLP